MVNTEGAEKRIAYLLGFSSDSTDHPTTINGDGNQVRSYGLEIIRRKDFGSDQKRAAYFVRRSTDELTHTTSRHVLAAHRVLRAHNYVEGERDGAYLIYR